MKTLGKWWRAMRLTCSSCGERFELDDEDQPHGYGTHYHVKCPSCSALVFLKKPWGM